MQQLPKAFSALAKYDQFILWKAVKRENGSVTKVPINWKTLTPWDAHDPSIWLSAEQAIIFARQHGDEYHVGFVFTKNIPFYFCDIDKCISSIGIWSSIAIELVERLPDAAVEISQSGRGLHIIGQGYVPDHRTKNTKLGLVFYTDKRFVALTGNIISGDTATDNTLTLACIINDYFPPTGVTIDSKEWRYDPVPEWNGHTNDNKLIEKALASKTAASIFGNKASFRDLWGNNVNVLTDAFPSQNETDPYDRSLADMSLACHLAFWTGKHHDRIRLLMRHSKLVRKKWERPDYLIRTITRACANQKDVYTAGNSGKTVVNLDDLPIPGVAETKQEEHTTFADYKIKPESELTNHDVANAITLLVNVFNNRLRTHAGRFYWWTGRYYEPVEDTLVRRLCGHAIMGSVTTSQHKVKSHVEAMRDHAQPIQELDPPTCCVFFHDGVLHMDTGELTHHHPDNGNTRTLNADYDP